jgi:hypothetical protein
MKCARYFAKHLVGAFPSIVPIDNVTVSAGVASKLSQATTKPCTVAQKRMECLFTISGSHNSRQDLGHQSSWTMPWESILFQGSHLEHPISSSPQDVTITSSMEVDTYIHAFLNDARS